MRSELKEINWMLGVPVLCAIWMFGGFYSYSVYFIGCLIAVLFVIKLRKSGHSRCEKYIHFYGLLILCLSAFASMFVAIDKGMSWYGCLRIFVIGMWGIYLMQFSKKERESVLCLIPLSGALMTIAGVITYVIPGMKEIFWQAQRLGGIFQYSNTFALFLIVGVIILTQKKEINIQTLALFDVLLAGIFLTGSRGGILILIPVLVWIFILKKGFRKNGMIVAGIALIGGLAYGMLTDNFQNIARIYTVFELPTTLLERCLYMLDSLPLIREHPLGMGYMGYYRVQPAIQTGIYTTMFVHNDWLQMILDYGVIFFGIVIALFVFQILKGKQEGWKKLILVVIALYSVLEFHLQYLAIAMTVTLLFDINEERIRKTKKAGKIENQIFAMIFGGVFFYFGIASFLSMSGNTEMALSLYPYDTDALNVKLQAEADKDEAVRIARELLELNPYNAQAYNVLAYASLMDGDVEKAIDYKYQILKIRKFDMNEYAAYEDFVYSNAVSAKEYEKALSRMQELLAITKESVHPIAYKLREKPLFTWE